MAAAPRRAASIERGIRARGARGECVSYAPSGGEASVSTGSH